MKYNGIHKAHECVFSISGSANGTKAYAYTENNTTPKPTAATVRWTLFICTVMYSTVSFGSLGNVINLSLLMMQPEENSGVAERSCYQIYN